MEIKKLYCIRKIIDPRYTDVSFEIDDTVELHNEIVLKVNDIDVALPNIVKTKEEKMPVFYMPRCL